MSRQGALDTGRRLHWGGIEEHGNPWQACLLHGMQGKNLGMPPPAMATARPCRETKLLHESGCQLLWTHSTDWVRCAITLLLGRLQLVLPGYTG